MDRAISCLIVLLAVSSCCLGEEEGPSNVEEEIIEHCMEQHGISENLVTEMFRASQIPETENVKCFIDCYWKEMDFINSNGMIDWNKISEDNKSYYSRPDEQAKIAEVTSVCKGKVPNNAGTGCETAFLAMKCFLEEARKRNLDFTEPNNGE